MSVVRELVARLGFQVDKAGFKEAERALDGVRKAAGRAEGEVRRNAAGRLIDGRGRFVGSGAAAAAAGAAGATGGDGRALKTLGKVAGTVGLTALLEQMVELGSRAEETQNVLSAVFGQGGAADVTAWAERTAVAVGRSKYALAEMAGQLGAVAQPMVKSQDRAREMSEAFAQLAVDMGSFYNTTDEDALAALRSALTGEVESIKRYGVVMNDATMQEYARTQGIQKKIATMTIAEKTELRYAYIMNTTKAAQGDAARTAYGYANSIKNVKSMLVDFGTDMGRAVLPRIERLLVSARDGIRAFKEFTQGTWLLEAGMWSLAGIAGVLALELVAPFIAPALAIGALILLVDDLYNLFNEGESAIGDFIDAMFGIGATEDMVNALGDAWSWLSQTFTELRETMPDIVGTFDMLLGVGDDLGFTIEYLVTKFLEFLDMVQNAPSKIVSAIGDKGAEWLGIKVPQGDAEGRTKTRGLNAEVAGSFGEQLELRQKERETRIRGEVAGRDVVRQRRLREREIKRGLAETEKKLEATDLSQEDRNALENTAAGLRRERESLTGESADAAVMSDASDFGPRFGVARGRAQEASRPAAAAPQESWTAGMSVDPSVFPQATVSLPGSGQAPMSAAPNVTQTNQTTIQINGGNTNEIRKVVQDVINANNRRAAAAIARPGAA